MRTTAVVAVALWLLPLLNARAQNASSPPRVVRASAEATVNAKPDRAEISIGVVSQGTTAEAAASANARQTSDVINTLKASVGTSGEIKTTGYAITPQYQYGNNTPPKLTGYRASNTVLVDLNEIGSVGSVIDASVKAGANNITGISFGLRNDQAVRQQAIAEATAKAKSNAEAIAKALAVEVVGVLQAETTGTSGVPPIRPMAMARAAAVEIPTPVESGTLEIRANVTVTLLIH